MPFSNLLKIKISQLKVSNSAHFGGRKIFLEQQTLVVKTGSLLARISIGSTLSGGADRKLETLHIAITELDGPHNGVRRSHRMNLAAHRHEVIVAANENGALRADLHARVALPAGIRLLIVRLHLLNVENHQIVGTDVHACGFVSTLATITLGRIYITWHSTTSSVFH